MADRLVELFFSVAVVGGSYFVLYKSGVDILWVYLLPALIFISYWWYLFSHEKISPLTPNKSWADRSWWWRLNGWDFEEEVAKVFRLNGYKARVTKKCGDDGVDIIMYKNKEKTIVQCKHYSEPVGVTIARELNGVKEDFKADKLIIVASSGVTQPCKDFIRNKPYFKILDLEDIIRLGLRPHSS